MRYHNITKDNMLNGDGLRVVLWVAGCEHQCKECHNPITWDINGGIAFDEEAESELFNELEKPYISGITFSGGDPLHPLNRQKIGELVQKIHTEYPLKTMWLYTGYKWEDICDIPYISMLDIVIDGKYEKNLHDDRLHWRGSSNQRIVDVKNTMLTGIIVQKEE